MALFSLFLFGACESLFKCIFLCIKTHSCFKQNIATMRNCLLNLTMSLLIFFSCENNNYRDDIDADMSVSITPSEDVLRMSTLFQTHYDMIVPTGVVLTTVSKVLMLDSVMIVTGKSFEGDAHLFKRSGEYLETLIKRGQGPNEAMSVWAVKIYQNDIYFLVNAGTEIMRYSLERNDFVDRFRLPAEIIAVADFEIMDNDTFIFYKNQTGRLENEYRLYVYKRKSNKIVDRCLPLPSKATEYLSFAQKDCLYKRDGKIFFYEVFQKGIYELTKEGLKGYIAFKDNKYVMPDKELYGNYTFDSFIDFCMRSPYIWTHRAMYEGPRFVMSNYMYKDEYYWNVIDKNKHLSQSYHEIEDDLLFEGRFLIEDYLYQTNIQGSARFFTLAYDDLETMLQSKSKDGMDAYWIKHKQLWEVYKSGNEDTNDLIIVFYEK